MKIGLFGNYGHKNLGDEALLEGAIACAEQAVGAGAQIIVFSDDAHDTRERTGAGYSVRQFRRPYGGRKSRLPGVVFDIWKSLGDLDWLVMGGGGLLNDSNRTAVPIYLLTCLMAKLRGVRVAWLSIGLGPLDSPAYRRMTRWILSLSDFVTVRDRFSSRLAEQSGAGSLPLTPDLAHALPPLAATAPARDGPEIGVSLVPFGKRGAWFRVDEAGYRDYCKRMAETVRMLRAARPDHRIVLFAISLEQDHLAIADVLAAGDFDSDPAITVCVESTVSGLRSRLSGMHLVLATRLHSAVLASVEGVPVVATAYQPKVASYVEELQVDAPVYDVGDFSPQALVADCLAMLKRREAVSGQLERMRSERRKVLQEMTSQWQQQL